MTDQAVAEQRSSSLRSLPEKALAAARFLVSDRLGLVFLLWLILAFVVRPIFLSAAHGEAGGAAGWLRDQIGGLKLARPAALMQWLSFIWTILLAVMTHMRFAGSIGVLKTRWAPLALAAGYAALLFV